MLYLDYAATTPVETGVAQKMMQYLTFDGNFANPASRSHRLGWEAEEAVETARQQVAELINADSREIIWTSGATEANNLALKGVITLPINKPYHIISSQIEHKAVIDPLTELQKLGVQTSLLTATEGVVSPSLVQEALQKDTVLVSLMFVNNELGTVNNIKEISAIIKKYNKENNTNVLLHVDAAQAAGKLHIDVEALDIDLMSLSAHKIYGPKGIGALYVRNHSNVQVHAQIHGGGHERSMRSGTLATHQIVGMGAAFALAQQTMADDIEHMHVISSYFWKTVSENIVAVYLHGHAEQRIPNILNISFAGVTGEKLRFAMPNIAISSGSACNSKTVAPSHVLTGIGVDAELAQNALRFSFGRYTTLEDVTALAKDLIETVEELRVTTTVANHITFL